MLKVIAVLLTLIPVISYGQESPSPFVKRISLEFGLSTAFTNRLPGTFNISIPIELRNDYLIAPRYYTGFTKDQTYPEANLWQTVEDKHFGFGKVFHLNKKMDFSFSTGPSLVKYQKPENIKEVHSFFNLFGPSYTYDNKTYHLLGWSGRLETKIYTHNYMGFSLGGVFNYNSKVSTGGINLNFIIYLKPEDVGS